MRYIPTSPQKIEALKKQAKKLQRKGGGKHADLLNLVARQAGYEHWHHVTLCAAAASRKSLREELLEQCAKVVQHAQSGRSVFLANTNALKGVPLVIFSTTDGDAWLLELNSRMALCLSWHREAFEPGIRETPTHFHIDWDGPFDLRGPFFEVQTRTTGIGHRAIAGYPLDLLRDFMDKTMTPDQKAAQVFSQPDGVDVTPEVLERFVARGADRHVLEVLIARGARYSPSRDTIILPPIVGDDEDPDELLDSLFPRRRGEQAR
ncbi:hypothetical protein QTI66_31970 [Variovorax sp. J22R133]|uniref:hypothetical protein n=1 Tax=Variovorax brevis TaxID=3053503 RepID=UPI002576CFFA|nr:hypothetical protein [Variovorax sp. J22R133]MDM0116754.1 hypothetical protein [Variovorax sp. J22R133]